MSHKQLDIELSEFYVRWIGMQGKYYFPSQNTEYAQGESDHKSEPWGWFDFIQEEKTVIERQKKIADYQM